MKRLFTLLLALVMVVSIVGCGGETKKEDKQANSGSETKTETKKEESKGEETQKETKTDAKEKVTIKFWHAWQGDEADKLQVYVDKFMEENPNIMVEVLSGTNAEKQMLALSGGDTFDVGYHMDYRMPLWGREGMLLPLNDLIQKANYNLDDVLDAELKLMTLDDNVYGLPFTVDTYLLYYNKDIVEELGLKIPETWDELYEAAKKAVVVDSNGDYTRLGFLNTFPWKNPDVFMLQNGGNYVDDKGNPTLDAPEVIEAMKFKASFHQAPDYNTEKIVKFQSGFGQYASSENAFLKGQLAFTVDGEWFPTFIEMYNPGMKYGIAPIPYNAKKPEFKNRGRVGGGALYIPKASKYPEEGFKLIDYLTNVAQVPFCIDKGSLPSTKSGLADPKLVEGAPTMKAFVDLALEGKLEAVDAVRYLTEMRKAINDAEDKIYDGTETVEAAYQQAQNDVKKVAEQVSK